MIIGGSPCQGFSFAGKQLNFNDHRSKLIFDFISLKNEINPKFWLLENVKMKKEYQDKISKLFNTEPIYIDSADFSCQTRKRLYWTNINVNQWFVKDVKLNNILEDQIFIYPCAIRGQYEKDGSISRNLIPSKRKDKINALTRTPHLSAVSKSSNKIKGNSNINYKKEYRILTPIEYERLQTIPDNYTSCISKTNRYHVIGNAWTVDVVAHIFGGLK